MTTGTELDVKRALTPRWTKTQVGLLKRTVAKGLTDDEFLLFMYTCKRTGLDPFIKQIYAIKRYSSDEKNYHMSIQTGIDGYRLIADRTRKYAGSDEPVFEINPDNHDRPIKATVTVHKMVDGEKCSFTGEARWSEFAQKNPKNGELMGRWVDMGFNQLAKCAEAQALRKAFPADLAGVMTHDESPVIDITIAEDGAGSDEPKPADTKPDTLFTGHLVGYEASNPQKKTPHRFTIKVDTGGEIRIGSYDLPAAIKKDTQKFVGRRVQFSYEEKPNPKGTEPFRNLKHLALEEVTVEEPKKADEPKKPQEYGAESVGMRTPSQQASDAPAAPVLTLQDYLSMAKESQSVKEVSEVGNMADADPTLSKEDTNTVRALVKQRMDELSKKK